MDFELQICGLLSTEYALDREQLEQRLIDAITAALKSDCIIGDLHVNVTLNN